MTDNARDWVIVIGRKVIEQNKGLFKRLEEYDRTGIRNPEKKGTHDRTDAAGDSNDSAGTGSRSI
ncbi:hypothetical protein NITHO_4880002 [Nitrolancea hollandica Lb]|uniref:Uncharacterized protein n=1 Tax=Nitrolancea hollandica Lb TaxID=1129897 RepID=I4EKZ5_9BACT|nr:hypothetical protein NITHO_4880002 [Nitrolancea hollandica Lb]